MSRLGREITNCVNEVLATAMTCIFATPAALGKGSSNETMNRLLRQYFPKGKEIAIDTQNQLDAIANKLNTRPRKRLGFKTPVGVFEELLH